MLKDEDQTTPAMNNTSGTEYSFKSARKTVLNMIDMFLRKVEKTSKGYGNRVEYSNGGKVGKFSASLTEAAIIGMLEASYNETIAVIYTFWVSNCSLPRNY